MTTRIPRAHNHWHLALTGYTRPTEPAQLPDRIEAVPLLWASPPWLATWSTAGPRLSAQAEDPRTRVARLVEAELGAASAWDLIREARSRTFELVAVENVIETAVWLTSQNRSE
ncbi:hypothetical protein ABZ896_52140 [Streptomyces sp. NPDC047072]|uniref:hypothetical protein n=1 Tax=Streptomyces sp. NPDC047072 TaxID=3154809 RepID=UPI00340C6BD2